MSDGVTNEVLAERLATLATNQREDFEEVKRQLGLLVSRELYDAHRAVSDARLTTLERELEALKKQRHADVERAGENHKSTIRWAVGAIFAALLTFLGNFYLQRTGTK